MTISSRGRGFLGDVLGAEKMATFLLGILQIQSNTTGFALEAQFVIDVGSNRSLFQGVNRL
jgi:hypothetical protein